MLSLRLTWLNVLPALLKSVLCSSLQEMQHLTAMVIWGRQKILLKKHEREIVLITLLIWRLCFPKSHSSVSWSALHKYGLIAQSLLCTEAERKKHPRVAYTVQKYVDHCACTSGCWFRGQKWQFSKYPIILQSTHLFLYQDFREK